MGAQTLAYLSPADELFFGGKAGAGKSDLGLGLGLTQHRKTLYLRREATQLQEVTSRIQELLRPGDRWRSSGYGGLLRTHDGRSLEFSGVDNEKDKQKYKGRAHDLKFWDEVVDFPESVYLFVNGWNRTTIPGQRCRVVAASNPPTSAEGEWVVRRWSAWLDPEAGNRAAPGELRYYTTIGDKEEQFPDATPVVHEGITYHPRSRTFIPGEMLDLLIATGYQNTLATLPEPLRSIYLKGDFGAARPDDRWQLIPTAWVKAAQARWERRAGNLPPRTRLGVDVAMGGDDQTCIAPLHEHQPPEMVQVGEKSVPVRRPTIDRLIRKPGSQTPDGQAVVALILAAGGANCGVNVDAIGIGKSAIDVARVMGLDHVRPVVVSERTSYSDQSVRKLKFANVRAAMMWNVRALLDPDGGPDETRLALPPDRELAADLTAPRYKMMTSGIGVESKDDIRERIGRSTDSGDAVALACWDRGPLAITI